MRPRVGFLGVGWIGRHRLEALVQSGTAEVVGIADPMIANAAAAAQLASCAPMSSLDQLLDLQLDGIVIATPSALHADQASAALKRGVAVFCQKPLARTAAETAQVVELARQADRLLGIDLSYRYAEAARRVRDLVRSGELGSIYAVDLVFHNAYGPDKAWFYDPALSGGGCVIDLGIHLVDLLLWSLEPSSVNQVSSRLFAKGQLLPPSPTLVEDFAWAELQLDDGAAARLACSWNLSAGRDAVIEVSFFGTRGAVRLSNVNGSFYDFIAERYQGTERQCICGLPDEWGGRAVIDWAQRLTRDSGFDSSADQLIAVAEVIDAIYGRQGTSVAVGRPVETPLEVPAGLS
jgi:predicted dehydrogenase